MLARSQLADGTLLDLIRRVRSFGISLTRLDIRQESDRHTEAIDAVTTFLGLGSYAEWDEEKKLAFLEAELASKRPLIPADLSFAPPPAKEVLETFAVLAKIPHEALGAHCISMSRAASDVLAVRLLLEKSGVKAPMRIAPLFETREDLQVSRPFRPLLCAWLALASTSSLRSSLTDCAQLLGTALSLWLFSNAG
eukprot:6187692-Pleurochrysis_carterae.AAC.1